MSDKSHEEYQYLNLLSKILNEGVGKSDRTGVGTLSIFGHQMRFDLENSIPVLTTKKIYWRGVVEELLWFIRGSTNSKLLEEKKVNIWKDNTTREFLDNRGLVNYPEGEAGPCYGWQWRNVGGNYTPISKTTVLKENNGIDQLAQVVSQIQHNPNDRRMIVSAWNPMEIDKMALPPCHLLYQFYIAGNKLSCQMYQRSCDTFLGVPFNIASYSLLVYLIAQITGYEPGEFIWVGGDVHIYLNHIEQVKEQLSREPYPFPKLLIKRDIQSLEDIEELEFRDLELIDYKCWPKIKAEMAV